MDKNTVYYRINKEDILKFSKKINKNRNKFCIHTDLNALKGFCFPLSFFFEGVGSKDKKSHAIMINRLYIMYIFI